MEHSHDAEKTIEELRVLEHHLQQFLAQKQAFEVELQEVEHTLNEVKKTNDEVYKILSGIMLKSSKNDVIKELEERRKLLNLRVQSLDKQQNVLEERAQKMRDKILEGVKEKKNEKK